MKNVLAIAGSLRTKSTNLTILEIIGKTFSDKINLTIYENLANLPHFNPDSDTPEVVESVADFRRRIKQADGVLICSPEYVFSVPAALKNALEWTVSAADFHHKPTALITASSAGEKAHESLRLILQTIEAKIGENSALLISHAQTKIKNGKINDVETVERLNLLIESFLHTMDK
ncbi:MAG: NAD(P)H-dependent oxidoreductase [Acidobacteriota bacterium]|nr:NAD(P)H-dependent oxidoreductase [Acidobacteriota bacterium]